MEEEKSSSTGAINLLKVPSFKYEKQSSDEDSTPGKSNRDK